MELTGPPSSTLSHRRKQPRRRRKDENTDKNKIVPLVVSPMLSFLWLFGFPVPERCTHNGISSERDGNSCLTTERKLQRDGCCKSIHKDKKIWGKSKAIVKPDDRVNSERVQVCEDVTVSPSKCEGETEKNGSNMEQSARTVSEVLSNILADEELTQKHVEFQPIAKRQAKFKQAIHVRGQPDDSRTISHAEKAESFTNCSYGATNQRCRTCQWKKLFGRALFVINVILFLTNIGQYATIFFGVTQLTVSVLASIIFMIFYISVLYVYVCTSWAMSKNLNKLVRAFNVYDRVYSVSVNCFKVRKELVVLITFIAATTIIFAILLVVGSQSFMPSFTRYLFPADYLGGASPYAASAAFSVVYIAMVGSLNCQIMFHYVVTYVLFKEFSSVALELENIFGSREDSLVKLVCLSGTHNLDDDMQASERPVRNHSTKLCTLTKKHEEKVVPKGEKLVRMSRRHSSSETAITWTRNIQSKGHFAGQPEGQCGTVRQRGTQEAKDGLSWSEQSDLCRHHHKSVDKEGVTLTDVTDDYSTQQTTDHILENFTETPSVESEVITDALTLGHLDESQGKLNKKREEIKGGMPQKLSGTPTKASVSTRQLFSGSKAVETTDGGQTKCREVKHTARRGNSKSRLENARGMRDVLNINREKACSETFLGVSDTHDKPGTHHENLEVIDQAEENDELNVEDIFDYLVTKHQMLCAILRHAKGCTLHLLATVFFM